MRARVTLYLGIGFFLAGAICWYSAFQIMLPAAARTRTLALLDIAMQTADEVDVDFLSDASSNPTKPRYRTKMFPEEYAIVSSSRLTKEQTQEFLRILEGYFFETGGGALCHDPGFVLHFSSHGHQILTASLCLHCTNMEIEPFAFNSVWVALFDREAKDVRLQRIEKFLAGIKKQ